MFFISSVSNRLPLRLDKWPCFHHCQFFRGACFVFKQPLILKSAMILLLIKLRKWLPIVRPNQDLVGIRKRKNAFLLMKPDVPIRWTNSCIWRFVWKVHTWWNVVTFEGIANIFIFYYLQTVLNKMKEFIHSAKTNRWFFQRIWTIIKIATKRISSRKKCSILIGQQWIAIIAIFVFASLNKKKYFNEIWMCFIHNSIAWEVIK